MPSLSPSLYCSLNLYFPFFLALSLSIQLFYHITYVVYSHIRLFYKSINVGPKKIWYRLEKHSTSVSTLGEEVLHGLDCSHDWLCSLDDCIFIHTAATWNVQPRERFRSLTITVIAVPSGFPFFKKFHNAVWCDINVAEVVWEQNRRVRNRFGGISFFKPLKQSIKSRLLHRRASVAMQT